MTKNDRIQNLRVGQVVTLTLSNYYSEVLTGTIESLTSNSIRLRTAERTIAVSTAHNLIANVRIEVAA